MTDESMSYLDALKEIKRLKETLNKIRAEIEEKMHTEISKHYDEESLMYHSFGLSDGLKDAIDIIDTHISELRGDTDVFDK